MLPKQHRLTRDDDFKMVFKRGQKKLNKFLVFYFLKRESALPIRFGFIVSNKVSNKANQRNLIKRRLRGCILRQLPDFKNGYDCLVVVRKSSVEAQRGELCEVLISLLQSAKLFK